MTIDEQIKRSIRTVGNGCYMCLTPIITEKGISLGWKYEHARGICFKGIRFKEMGLSLETLQAEGLITLQEQVNTGF